MTAAVRPQRERCPVTGKIMCQTRREGRDLRAKIYRGTTNITKRKVFRCGWCETYHVGRPRGHGGGRA